MIVRFPDLKVDIKTKGSQERDYLHKLGFSSPVPVALAYALAWGIEGSKEFFGATIDDYADGLRQGSEMSEKVRKVTNREVLEYFYQDFAKMDLVSGVVLAPGEAGWVENKEPEDDNVIYKGRGKGVITKKLIRDSRPILAGEEIRTFLHHDAAYDWKRVAHTIFIPSAHFTQEVWGFSYDPQNLGTIVRYDVDPQKPEPKKEPKIFDVGFSKPDLPGGPRQA